MTPPCDWPGRFCHQDVDSTNMRAMYDGGRLKGVSPSHRFPLSPVPLVFAHMGPQTRFFCVNGRKVRTVRGSQDSGPPCELL